MQRCDFYFPEFWGHVIINEVLSILSRLILFSFDSLILF